MLAYNELEQLWPIGTTDVYLNGMQLLSAVLAPDNLCYGGVGVEMSISFITELCNISNIKGRTIFYLAKLPQTNKCSTVTPTHTHKAHSPGQPQSIAPVVGKYTLHALCHLLSPQVLGIVLGCPPVSSHLHRTPPMLLHISSTVSD